MDKLCRKAVALLATAILFSWAGQAQAQIATIAKTGDPAPGTAAKTFSGVNAPSINAAGEVAFKGSHSGGRTAIWVGSIGNLSLLVESGTPAPDAGTGVNFSGFGFPVINGAGDMAVGAVLDDGGEGIWASQQGSLLLVARDGQTAPGAGGVATFTGFGLGSSLIRPFLNIRGEVSFGAQLSDGGEGLWVGRPGNLSLIARDGMAAPGTTGGEIFTGFGGVSSFAFLNGVGEVAFEGFLDDGSRGLWAGRPGALALVARTGEPAPGIGGGATFTLIRDVGFSETGEVVFTGELSVGGLGLWVGGPDGLFLLAQTGVQAPGVATGTTFTLMTDPFINSAGDLSFRGFLDDGRLGLWVGDRDFFFPVVLGGQVAPGTDGMLTFEFPDTPLGLSGAGEVVFRGHLSDSSQGIWTNGASGLEFVARVGGDIEVAPGDMRTVSEIRAAGSSNNEDGRHSMFSAAGQTVFEASFTNATRGIFLSPPEAPNVQLLSLRAVDSKWDTMVLPQSFTRPVVIAGPPSFGNRAPGMVRLRNIGTTSFQAKFQEWKYLDGSHSEESVDFLVMNKGRRKLADGSIWEAGTLKVSGNGAWKSKAFTKRFPGTPKIFLTIQSSKDKAPVTVRARNVSRTGFQAALFEEEKLFGGSHGSETVGYLAVFSGTNRGTVRGGVSGTAYKLKRPGLTNAFKTVLGRQFKLEEEKSKDRERSHVSERVSVLRLGRGHFAQQVTDNERDTTAIRKRPPP